MKKILVISKSIEIQAAFQGSFTNNVEVNYCSDRISGLEQFQNTQYDITFLDVELTESINNSQSTLIDEFKKNHSNSKVVILTHQKNIRETIELLKNGASDYLTYPVDPAELKHITEKMFTDEREEAELNYLRDKITNPSSAITLATNSSKMSEIYQKVEDVASTKSTVLIYGDTGVGKTHLAKLIHKHSSRNSKQLIHVHCGAIPDSLIESELFGHEKGAFTGSIKRRLGKFELANKGTIFLDEVSTLTMSAQIKLLTVLQDSSFQRVGGEDDIAVDIRIIAATNENLEDLVAQGSFRKDLFYRLNVFPILIPSLKERPEDIPSIVTNYIKKLSNLHNKNISGIQFEAMETLVNHSWPGNIRELENIIERSFIVEKSEQISIESLPVELTSKGDEPSAILPLNLSLSLSEARSRTIENFERQYLKEVLTMCNGKIKATAEISGVGVRQLNKLMNKYKLQKDDFKQARSFNLLD